MFFTLKEGKLLNLQKRFFPVAVKIDISISVAVETRYGFGGLHFMARYNILNRREGGPSIPLKPKYIQVASYSWLVTVKTLREKGPEALIKKIPAECDRWIKRWEMVEMMDIFSLLITYWWICRSHYENDVFFITSFQSCYPVLKPQFLQFPVKPY